MPQHNQMHAGKRWRWKVEVSGWDKEGEYITEEGYGLTEESAVQDAVTRYSIREIGEVNIIVSPR